jgi:hypothetical protein
LDDVEYGLNTPDVEYGLNVLWNRSFRNGQVYKENLGFFTPDGLLIAPNMMNTTHSSSYGFNYFEKEIKDKKLFVKWGNQKLQVLGIIHTHPNRSSIQKPTPRNDFQYGFMGIHNYVMSTYYIYDAFIKNGREYDPILGRRHEYNKLPMEFFGFKYKGW